MGSITPGLDCFVANLGSCKTVYKYDMNCNDPGAVCIVGRGGRERSTGGCGYG